MANKATTQRRRAASVPRDPELTPEQEALISMLPQDLVRRAGAKKGATPKGFSFNITQILALIKLITAIVEQVTSKSAPPTA